MGLILSPRIGVLLFAFIYLTLAEEDSLKSALNAVNRRQWDLPDYSQYEGDKYNYYGYSQESPDDLAFLSQPSYQDADLNNRNANFARRLMEYLKDYEQTRYNREVKKRISSSFRERLEEDKERQLEELARSYLETVDQDRDLEDDDDTEIFRELLDKYQTDPAVYNEPRAYLNKESKKYSVYPRWGLDSAGLRKRTKYEPDIKYYHGGRNADSDYDWSRGMYYNKRDQNNNRRHIYNGNYQISKRFPVSKRSYLPEITHEHKRSTSKKDNAIQTHTDTKVANDLSNVFGHSNTNSVLDRTTKTTVTTIPPERPLKKATTTEPAIDKNKTSKDAMMKISKEEFSNAGFTDRLLEVKKKSIDWSDYFGLDRRKKSDDDLDKQWLQDRYHKTVTTKAKRNPEYPLQSFKNHDQLIKKISSTTESYSSTSKDNLPIDESKIKDIDAKLKSMEESIIEKALKYTGAHEGTTDSHEIQEVKDRIISRLAAAYSLEKMRRALGEYKLNMAKEREKLTQQEERQQRNDDYDLAEEKRVSVPRKQAVVDEREKIPESDNNIKCSQGNEDCEEQSYQTPLEVLEQASAFETCPKVQRACSEVATILGQFSPGFETACNMHQMCLLCSNNSWFAPTRQCNILYLSKAFQLCEGKLECQKEAQRSVSYLLDVNHSLTLEPLGECELFCPDRQ